MQNSEGKEKSEERWLFKKEKNERKCSMKDSMKEKKIKKGLIQGQMKERMMKPWKKRTKEDKNEWNVEEINWKENSMTLNKVKRRANKMKDLRMNEGKELPKNKK